MEYNDNSYYGDEDYSILYGPQFDPEYMFGEDFDVDDPEYMGAWITAAFAALKGAGKGIRAIGRAVRRRRGGSPRRRKRVFGIARKIFRRIKRRRRSRKKAGRGIFRRIRARRRAKGKRGLFAKIRARRRAKGKKGLFAKIRARRAARKARKRGITPAAKPKRRTKLFQRLRARRLARKAERAARPERTRVRPFKMMADNIAQSYRDSINPNTSMQRRSGGEQYEQPVRSEERVYDVPTQQKGAGTFQAMMAGPGKYMIFAGVGLAVLTMVMKNKPPRRMERY